MSEMLQTQEPEATVPTPQDAPKETTTTTPDETWTDIGPGMVPIENPNPDPEAVEPVETQPEPQIDTQIIENESSQPAEVTAVPPAETAEAPAVTVLGETIEKSTVDVSEVQDSNAEAETIAEVGVPKEASAQAEHTPAKIGAFGAAIMFAAGVAARFKRGRGKKA